MDIHSLLAFAVGSLILAASPGPGLGAVLSRSTVSGLNSGFMVVTGLVIVDFLFLGLAIVGLSAVATLLGPFFQIVKYGGALYLIWLGYQTFKAAGKDFVISPSTAKSRLKDIGLGVIVTLGNPKAILFFGAFLPTFFDVSEIGLLDYLIICLTIVAVSVAVYGAYMLLFRHIHSRFADSDLKKRIHQVTGSYLAGSGVLVALR